MFARHRKPSAHTSLFMFHTDRPIAWISSSLVLYRDPRSGSFTLAKSRPGGPVVIILATGSEVHGFKPERGRWILSERKNPEYNFLRKGSKAVGNVS